MEDRFLKAAQTVVQRCLAVKSDETVLVVADQPEREIGNAIFEAAKEHCAEAFFLEIIPREHHGEEPPAQVAELMRAVDVVIAPTFRSLSHTEARRNACKSGTRIATLPGILRETFVRAMVTDYSKIFDLSTKLADMLSAAKTARVVSDSGTDIAMSLEGRRGIADTGIYHNSGDFGNLPAGEAYIAPLESTANGVFVIDGSIGDTGVLATDDKIKIRVENGFATEIDGSRASAYLVGVLSQFTKDARNIAELGIGTNSAARLCGNILEDEKVLGTIHIALGDNASMGGNVHIPSHLDGIMTAPTLWLDGKTVMEHGRLKV